MFKVHGMRLNYKEPTLNDKSERIWNKSYPTGAQPQKLL